jgi:hypothetical protein
MKRRCEFQMVDFRVQIEEVRPEKSKICNLQSKIDLAYSIVDPSCVYRYFFPSQNNTDDVFSPSPLSSM